MNVSAHQQLAKNLLEYINEFEKELETVATGTRIKKAARQSRKMSVELGKRLSEYRKKSIAYSKEEENNNEPN